MIKQRDGAILQECLGVSTKKMCLLKDFQIRQCYLYRDPIYNFDMKGKGPPIFSSLT